ncbi:unnamed protein product, partial [marine sediment metagenome]
NYDRTNSMITYDPQQSDLTAPYVWWGITSVSEGEPTWVRWQVRNDGEVPASSSYAKAWLSTDNDLDTSDDYYLGERSVVSLVSGESDYPQWDFDMPDLGSGTYSVWMLCEVDSQGEVVESNENNLYKSNDDVFFTASDPADLVAPYVWWGITSVSEGEPTWVRWQVRNDGEAPASSSHAKAWLSTDNDFDTSDDYYLGERPVVSLASGGSDYPQWDFDMPDLGSGTYSVWMLCEVDSQGEVVESNENNLYKSNDDVFFTASDPADLVAPYVW